MRTIPLRLAAGGLAMFLGAAGTPAPDALNASDLRCLAVAATNANSNDPKAQVAATIAAMYWIGRLQGRDPAFDIENGLVNVSRRLTPVDLQSEGVRCALAIKAQGRALVEMGGRISARESNRGL